MVTLYHMSFVSYHGEEGDGSGGMVVNGNEVDHEGSATDKQGKEGGSHQHLLDPVLACITRNINSQCNGIEGQTKIRVALGYICLKRQRLMIAYMKIA